MAFTAADDALIVIPARGRPQANDKRVLAFVHKVVHRSMSTFGIQKRRRVLAPDLEMLQHIGVLLLRRAQRVVVELQQ